MPTVEPVEFFRLARRNGYAIGAFNAVNLETAGAIVSAAELEASPVVLQVSENASRYAGFAPLTALCLALREEARVPVILHYDHAESLASAVRALGAGYQGVMVETAHLAPDAALCVIRDLVAVAARSGAFVEAELEIVHKGHRQGGPPLGVEELRDRARRSGCQLVAIDVGSRHKQRRCDTRLDLERLAAVAGAIPEPLVLHGGSGIHPDDIRRAVALGVAKVNLATDLSIAFTGALRAALADGDRVDPRLYLAPAREALVARVRYHLRALGGAGKAAS
jgi:fructose-bisphosphate aldolase, class II